MKNLLTEKCVSSHWLNFHQKGIKRRMERKVDSRSSRDGAVKKPYSPKIMSKKKSSAFSGICSEIPRARHPVQYHPSYAWTRRGRLRELRIRCMARKFLYLWIRMTFGRVFPSKARFYYEQRILQKVFEEWKEEWWVSHREWKLRVRADCHYRYYLYNLMFQTWKTYVHQQREMRNKYLRAEDHDAKRKMRQAWKSWLIYVVFRRTKLRMQTTALEFRQRSTLWVWWSTWRWQLGQVHLGRALHASAVKHRAQSLQLQAWSRWQEQLLHVWRERQKMVSAVKHHQHWQQWRALRAWLEYLQVRREKRQRKEMAEGFHCVIVLQTHFCDWRWAWKRRESLYIHHERVEGLARRMVLRRAFIHWKHYVLLCAETAVQRKVAEEHHRRALLHFCFRALKDNVARAHLQRIRKNLAHQQHDVTLLHRFWNLWQSQIEQREESEQLPFLCAAWDHYRITLLRKCFQLWLQYTQKRRSQQLLQARADSHFQRRALPGAFQAWRRLWQWHQQERVLYARAARFHRVMLEKRLFALWCQKVSQHREHRLAERMAILHAERQFLRRSWSMWCQQAVAHRLERQRQAVACAHHRLRWLRKAFCVWRERARGLRTERTGRARAARFHAAQLLCWAWSRWRERLALHSAEQQKLMRADLHRQHTLLYRVLQTWGVYQSRVRSVLQEVAARESRHERRLLRGALRRWRENAVAQADEAKKASRAAAHYRRTLCSKVLIAWREAVSVQIYYRQQEGQAVRDAQVALNRGCLRIWFRRWRDRSWSAAQQRVQMERVMQHYRRQLLLQAMARWKVHHLSCIRKRLLQRQAARLLAQTLSRTCFHQWRQQLADRRREQQDTARALWFWAFSLQAKVWAAWLGFVLEMRRKKARQERAVQAYHQQLLREGVTRLLCFAAGMKAFRQQLHAQQQVQAAHSLHRVVRRCATLWKKKALGLGREPQPPTSTVCSRRVTFEGPLPSHLAAGAGDVSLETKRTTAPRGLRGALDSLPSAAGDTQLLELNAAHWARKQPRRPSFLLEPIESQTPLGCGTLGAQGPEALWEHGLGEVQPIGLVLTTPFLAKAQTALDPSSPLPSAPGLKPPPTASTGLELLPPSSFMLRGAEAHAWASAQPTIPGLKSQAPSSLASVPNPRLLLPGDFTGTRPGPGSDTAGVYLGPVSASSAQVTPGTWNPWVQPGPRQEDGQDQAYSPIATGHMDLEAELEGIQQQLQDYQTTKQNLRSCQRQASSLRQWLELSQEAPRPEDQEAEQQVQEELQEVRPWAAPRRLPGGASSQPAPSTSPGGSADPAAGLQVAGPAPAHPHLYRPHPCPAAGSVLVTTPRPGTECKTAASFFISKCCN
ncbi:protein SFI1 homolog isoform X3 [Orcinus orca]|uniref:protein SFI1 homolog isoform X3 n=1 Tax=Orcinus orca TaxID=9733 RepID=UPI0021116061|nr:protein SFI1 homolog isoform X3 [Orcinus orca]XP_033268730.2 protein SFI1 homolog isoform X3 [Orcinus orca]XP_033268731.2 protein SFI1 homolog isoform X3 [Orcinus orca]